MSDFSQGEGWWQASDGKWYPPEAARPGFAAPTSEAPAAPVPPVAPTQPFGPPIGQPMGPPPGGAPTVVPAPLPTPAKSGLGTGPIIAIVVAAVLVIGAIVFFATSGDGDKNNAAATESSSSSDSSSSRSSSSTSASSSSSSGAPDVVAPPGFNVFSNDKDAFALAVPDNLEIVDLSTSDIEGLISQFTATNPQFSTVSDEIRKLFSGGGKLFAVDLTGASAGDNLSVIETPGFDITSSATKTEVQTRFEASGKKNVALATKTIHGRKILTVRFEGTRTTSDGTLQSLFGGQALIAVGSKIWILTLASGADVGTAFDTIVQSFDVNE